MAINYREIEDTLTGAEIRELLTLQAAIDIAPVGEMRRELLDAIKREIEAGRIRVTPFGTFIERSAAEGGEA